MIAFCTGPISTRENTARHVQHGKPRHFRTWWAMRNPPGCIVERHRGILRGWYVSTHQRPKREEDGIEAKLRQNVAQNPTDVRATQDLINHLARICSSRANTELPRFRKAAIHRRKEFFRDLRTWLISPYRAVNPQPDAASAVEAPPKGRQGPRVQQ